MAEFTIITEEFIDDLSTIRALISAFDDPHKGTAKARVAAANSATLLLAATFEEFIREMALTCAQLVIRSSDKFENLPRNLAPVAWRRTLEGLARIDVGSLGSSGDSTLSAAMTRFNAVYEFCKGDLSQDIYSDLIHNENNMRPRQINTLFKLSDLKEICSQISDKTPLMDNFGESEPGKTHGRVLKYLDEFFDRRNDIAHSLRGARSSGPDQILKDVDVFDAFGKSLAETLEFIFQKASAPTPAALTSLTQNETVHSLRRWWPGWLRRN